MYQPHWKRLPDGKVVSNNESEFGSLEDFRSAVAAQTPWVSKWVLSTQGRRTLKKDIPRLLMYNLVSPMDYGSSLRSSKVRRRRNKAVRIFLMDNLALPLLKSLGRVAWNLIQSHYVGYFEDEMFAQRLKLMNSSEMIREFNLTLPADAIEVIESDESRPNTTLAFKCNGDSLRAQLYARYSAAFSPEAEVNKSVGQVGTRMSGREIQALEQIQLQLQEFYFETGIPRFASRSNASATKRAMRLEALLGMVQVAFEAERRALNHGLQGPSTVWYSSHDLDVDEFADAVLGTVNLSVSEDPTPLHVFEYLLNERVPILDDMVSYYADTNHDTKVSMELNQSVPMLDKLIESELIELVSVVESQIKVLGESIAFYVETRAASPQYHEVVNATAHGDLYNGSEYTLVGFGFIMPATNDKNVLYYDLKLPVPFHLALRLIIRFQESRLLLPEESRQLLVCLAMALNNISFYRCRPAATSATPPDDK
uniref:Uncharacterized protein n=1 Tax=Phytophthora ramorum TaxID=164328 RepID=H3HBK7_PHYRM